MGKTKYQIQFQKGLGLPEFYDTYGSEEQCELHLQSLKWPYGFVCPKCGNKHYSRFRRNNGRLYFQCKECRHQSSLTSDTMFHGSNLPLKIWFLALYLVSEAKTQLSSLELHRLIHVNHKTAWLMLHKIMEVMRVAEEDRILSGRIEMDDAYLGGKCKGGKPGRGAADKQPFIAAVQTTDEEEPHPHYMKLAPVTTFSCDEVKRWTKQHISPGSHVVTDALACFAGVEETCFHEVHTATKMTEEEKELHFKWVNTILSNIKTGITGAFHSFECSKYSMRYLSAIVFRFNHRYDLELIFRDLLCHATESPPSTIHEIQL